MLMHPRKQIVVALLLLLSLIFGACAPTPGPHTPGVQTWTPLPSATATCSPDTTLSTPEGWGSSSKMIIFLFDPNLMKDQDLELSDGTMAEDTPSFLTRLIPELLEPGDQVSGFSLGYTSFVPGHSSYEAARVTRLFSYMTRPLLYNTPSPIKTLTPLPTLAGTLQPGLVGIATANGIKAQSTAHARTALANNVIHDCEVNYWNTHAMLTATAWQQTQTAENDALKNKMKQDFDDFVKKTLPAKPPTTSEELYDGLANASIDLADPTTGCKNYDQCSLIIIANLFTYPSEYSTGRQETNPAGSWKRSCAGLLDGRRVGVDDHLHMSSREQVAHG